MSAVDPRLILREEELDRAVELMLLAAAALYDDVDAALAQEPAREGLSLGRGHWRVAFLLKRRPGLGVRELARLTGLTKQGASRTLGELERGGLVEKAAGDEDARRRPARLTAAGEAFEARVGERLRALLASAYRAGGLDAAPGALRVWAAMAGGRLTVGQQRERG